MNLHKYLQSNDYGITRLCKLLVLEIISELMMVIEFFIISDGFRRAFSARYVIFVKNCVNHRIFSLLYTRTSFSRLF